MTVVDFAIWCNYFVMVIKLLSYRYMEKNFFERMPESNLEFLCSPVSCSHAVTAINK